jgi:hypothetical protein
MVNFSTPFRWADIPILGGTVRVKKKIKFKTIIEEIDIVRIIEFCVFIG